MKITRSILLVMLGALLAGVVPVSAQSVEIVELPTIPVSVDLDKMQLNFVMAWSPDGTLLSIASGGPGEEIVQIWDVETGQEVVRMEGNHALAVAFSPDGKLLATFGSVGNLLVMDVADLLEAKVLGGEAVMKAAQEGKVFRNYYELGEENIEMMGIMGLTFSPDSSALLIQMSEPELIDIREPADMPELFRTSQPQPLRELTLPGKVHFEPGQVTSVGGAFRAITSVRDGGRGMTTYTLNDITLDLDGGTASVRPLFGLEIEKWGIVRLSANGNAFDLLDSTYALSLIDGPGNSTVIVPAPESGSKSYVQLAMSAVNADGTMVAGAYMDGTIKLWDSAGQELLAWNVGALRLPSALSFSPDNRTLILVTRDDVKVWRLSGDLVTTPQVQPTSVEPTGAGYCQDIDLSATISLLVQAQTAASSGDSAAAVQLMADARAQLTGFEAVCSVVVEQPRPEVVLGEPYTLQTDLLSLTFNYPPGWVMDTSQDDTVAVATSQLVLDEKGLSQNIPPLYDPGEALIVIMADDPVSLIGTDDANANSVVELLETLVSGLGDSLGATVGETTALSLGDREAAKSVVSATNFDISLILVDLNAVRDGSRQLAVLLTLAAPGELPDVEATALAMAETFKVR